ncbi:TetR/AcrR family transcriptional regulator [Mycolicibacterium sp. A43C]
MAAIEPTATRDKERTRRAILVAAQKMFSERGSKASLADIATSAGVTQSGLRHHFHSREALLFGVAEDIVQRYWTEIHNMVDLSENRPGKLMRAYVRALTGADDLLSTLLDPTSLSAALGHPAIFEDLFLRDAARWRAALAADGLPMDLVLVIQHAAEGLAMARKSPYLTEADLQSARTKLLAMTEDV